MRLQWSLVLAFIFALLVATFSVLNVEPVDVDYFMGVSRWPLILVILGSVLSGMIIMGAVGTTRIVKLQRELKKAKGEKDLLTVRNHLGAKENIQSEEDFQKN